MMCDWQHLIGVLPLEIRSEVDKLGRGTLQELRLRLGRPVELICSDGAKRLCVSATEKMMEFTINTASRYSPWAAASQSMGYLTAPGGHRIGICGETVVQSGKVTAIKHATSLCIRVARDFPGIGHAASGISGNLLIIGPPGCGKTTLLRDIVRCVSQRSEGSVAVVDERGEIFPPAAEFDAGPRTDVLTGCPKPQGIDMVLRTMGPSCIAVDEITAEADCDALEEAAWCGVRLLATAHASGKEDLRGRRVYKKLVSQGLFETLLILDRDKNWKTERMSP